MSASRRSSWRKRFWWWRPSAVAADGFVGDAEFGADVAVGAFEGLDLVAEPVGLDGPVGFVADEPDASVPGGLGEQLAVDAGFDLDGGEVLAGLQVLALEEGAGEQLAGAFAQSTRGGRGVDAERSGWPVQPKDGVTDVVDGNVELPGCGVQPDVLDDDESVHGVKVDVVGVAAEQREAGDAAGGWGPRSTAPRCRRRGAVGWRGGVAPRAAGC